VKREQLNATIKGVESVGDKFRPFVERHVPCRAPAGEVMSNVLADHSRCTITQRFVGPTFATIGEAVAAAERCEVIKSDGKPANLRAVGS
jgi:hypothetical protein